MDTVDQQPSLEGALSLNETASRLGVSRAVAWGICQRGELRAYKVGRRWLVRPQDLADYIRRAANTQQTA